MRVHNRLAEMRRQRGLSVIALAARVGVKRQTIYALEAQRYVPNTLLALRLAQALDVPVEGLFSIEAEASGSGKPMPVDLLTASASPLQPGRPVRLCCVGKRMIGVPSPPVSGELPVADAIVVSHEGRGRTLVQPFHGGADERSRLIVAGCDPAMPALARHAWKHGHIEVITPGCSSLQALQWLKTRKVHVAGTHLRSESQGGSGRTFVERMFPKGGFRIVTFASWEEGLVLARTNPKGIRDFGDLVRKDVMLVNREVGAGARFLLDSSLKKEGIDPKSVRGYEQSAAGHILAAWTVHLSRADCCIATRAAARVFGLSFLPLVSERYDLVIPDAHWELPAVQILLDIINGGSLRRELELLGGYDTSQTGRLVTAL